MWQKYSTQHTQRGDVTAVVWGAPGISPKGEKSAGAAGAAGGGSFDESTTFCSTSSRSTPPGGEGGVVVVDAEALTRGRRAETPFVQQCDLVFPLPGRVSGNSGGGGGGDVLKDEQKEAEARAKDFVRRRLGKAFYYRARGPLSAVLSEPFLGKCVLRGGFSALALNAPSDQGNSFAILPGGVLVLSLDRESFQTLGLPGAAAHTRPKGKDKRAGAGAGSTGGSKGVLGGGAGGPDRYVSAFDLSSKAFRPGKPLHDRVLSCLGGGGDDLSGRGDNGTRSGVVDMVVCWWGEEDGAGKESRRNSGLLGQEETSGDGKGAVAVTNPAGSCSGNENREGECMEEGPSEQQHRHQQRECREQCCREVSFPPGFSAERVEITPDLRFFREACCPDLDFVGQGFADTASTATAPPPSTTGEEGGGRALNTDNIGDGGLIANADSGISSELSRQEVSHPIAHSLRPPPGTTKCRLVLDMFEWLGAVSCGLEGAISRNPSPPEPHLSGFETPRHLRYRRHRTVCRARLRGFLPPLVIARFVKASGLAAAGPATIVTGGDDSGADGRPQPSPSSSPFTLPVSHARQHPQDQRPDGSSWGSVTAWPFQDAPRAYPGADAPCAGGQKSKQGGGKHRSSNKGGDGGRNGGRGVTERATKEWPVGGHGVYTVVSCPGETAVAYVSARCPGPGW